MKKSIHPKYYPDAKVTCTCGNNFTTGSTIPEIKVEICSSCHPFFTGQSRFVDAKGRIDKFEEKRAAGVAYLKAKKAKSSKTRSRVSRLKP